MTHQFTSEDDFARNCPQIRSQVSAILAAKGKLRSDLQLLAVYEDASGELVAEVLRTSVGPVVVYRPGGDDMEVMWRADARDGSIFRQSRGEPRIEPFTGDPEQHFQMQAHAQTYVVTGRNLLERTYPGGVLIIR